MLGLMEAVSPMDQARVSLREAHRGMAEANRVLDRARVAADHGAERIAQLRTEIEGCEFEAKSLAEVAAGNIAAGEDVDEDSVSEVHRKRAAASVRLDHALAAELVLLANVDAAGQKAASAKQSVMEAAEAVCQLRGEALADEVREAELRARQLRRSLVALGGLQFFDRGRPRLIKLKSSAATTINGRHLNDPDVVMHDEPAPDWRGFATELQVDPEAEIDVWLRGTPFTPRRYMG